MAVRGVNAQLDGQGKLKHFLSIDGLSRSMLSEILDTAESFAGTSGQAVKKLPLLRGKVVCNLFFERSTDSLAAFELAAKSLSADVLNPTVSAPAAARDGALPDTPALLESMHADLFVVRHAESGAAHFFARHAAPHVSIINAGDGRHAHPAQAMQDVLTIRRHKGDFTGLRVAIVGDLHHSGIARSQILALNTLGTSEVRIIAPRTLLPEQARTLGVHIYHDLDAGIRDVDVIIVQPLQKTWIQDALIPSENEYFQRYGLTEARLAHAKEDVTVIHPGPINRDLEMDPEVADGAEPVLLQQIGCGIAVRMAIMSMLMGGQAEGER